MENIEKPVNQREMAAFFNIGTTTLMRLRNEGKIPYLKVRGKVMYQPSMVLKALNQNTRQS